MSGALLLSAGPAAPRVRWPLLALVLLVTALADALLWTAAPGLSLGLAALGAAALMLLRARGISRRAWIAAALLAMTTVQTAIEATDANRIALLVLLLVLFAEAAYPALPAPAARIAAALRALLAAWTRWRPWWRQLRHGPARSLPAIGGAIRVLLPALLLALPFALLLGFGNAVLGEWMSRVLLRTLRWLARLDLALDRLAFWLFAATLALALLRPARPPRHRYAVLGGELAPWQRKDPRLARWQGVITLVALNALFLLANTADALHLWAARELPPGVGFSAFVHQGTDALILATLLSGAVLAAVFQQPAEVTRGPLPKGLALAWIAQNLVLLASVALRLWLYVEAYQLTLLRVWLALFLVFVAGGFVLLARHVVRGTGLWRLVRANVALATGLCLAVQFVDVPGLVADTNVRLWRASLDAPKPHPLDLDHLAALGPSAWPALQQVANDPRSPLRHDAGRHLAAAAGHAQAELAARDWRARQFRPDRLREQVIACCAAR